MKWLEKLVILLSFSFFISCGIQENYYLPQVPDSYVTREVNTNAVINIPSINSYYFSRGYRIFYRIYITNHQTSAAIDTANDRNNISPALASDFNALEPVANPANTTSITSVNTFRNRNYFELELEGVNDISQVLTSSGGTASISFSPIAGENPVLSINGRDYILLRSTGEGTRKFSPLPDDRYFFSTPELNAYENAVSETNGDVARGRPDESDHSYVSMYIVAVGQDPVGFGRVYSKPTYISIFRLPLQN